MDQDNTGWVGLLTTGYERLRHNEEIIRRLKRAGFTPDLIAFLFADIKLAAAIYLSGRDVKFDSYLRFARRADAFADSLKAEGIEEIVIRKYTASLRAQHARLSRYLPPSGQRSTLNGYVIRWLYEDFEYIKLRDDIRPPRDRNLIISLTINDLVQPPRPITPNHVTQILKDRRRRYNKMPEE